MKIKTHAIPRQYQEHILSTVNHRLFPWFSVHETYQGSTRMTFSHLVSNDGPDLLQRSTASPYYDMLLPISFAMSELIGKPIKKILRIRLGLILPTNWVEPNPTIKYQQAGEDPHVDFFMPHYTGLYYINDSDGDTVVYNETKESDSYTKIQQVSPEKGKIFIFDGKHYHSSGTPKHSSHRLVATFNFITE
jgi:hypothetical protein